MLAGPKSGLTAVTSTPGEAAALAAAPIFTVIERVVLGLMTWMCMISLSSGRTGVFRRPSARDDGHLVVQSASPTKSGLQDRGVRTARELACERRRGLRLARDTGVS